MIKYSSHRLSKSSEYAAWKAIKQRCLNTHSPSYQAYGGRGIKVCKKWKKSFPSFFADMGDKPSSKHSIDRIDNDGNYSCGRCLDCLANRWPSNCRWATAQQQAINRRPRQNKTGYTGVVKVGNRFIAHIRINGHQVKLGSFNVGWRAHIAYLDAKARRDAGLV